MDCLVSPTTRSVQVMRIPVLMFDFGNVVGFFDYSTVYHRLGLKLGLSAQQFETMMYERGAARLGVEFESGRLTAEEFARQVTELAGLEMSLGVRGPLVGYLHPERAGGAAGRRPQAAPIHPLAGLEHQCPACSVLPPQVRGSTRPI